MPHFPRTPVLMIALALIACPEAAAVEMEDGFVPLLADGNFDGWEKHGGKATYAFENGEVVGTSVAKTQNTFLCTKKTYGDFILELEVKVDEELNSGIQIRSHFFPEPTEITYQTADGKEKTSKLPADRVFGYQIEIDPSERAWSAGVYDEARRGWLFNLEGEDKAAARAAFKHGEWNQYRIEAVGNQIKTWLNGVPVADLTDDMDADGLIALQVHAVADRLAGKQVRWRKIRIKEVKAAE